MSSATIMMATYGHTVKDRDDPYVSLVDRAMSMTLKFGNPGSTPVDFIPVRKSDYFIGPTPLDFVLLKISKSSAVHPVVVSGCGIQAARHCYESLR